MLGAGAGSRLRPLTDERPKPLCPVGDRALVDHAIERVRALTADVAVNVHHGRTAMEDHLGDRVHVSVEAPIVLGTAGALAGMRSWLDGRGALVVNADTYTDIDLAPLIDGWDGERVRIMVAGSPAFHAGARVVGSLVPAGAHLGMALEPAGLYETCWRPAQQRGELDVLGGRGQFHDCGTPLAYLRANLVWSGGAPVIGDGATVAGRLERSVVWPRAVVGRNESLREAIRTTEGRTVLVRPFSAVAGS